MKTFTFTLLLSLICLTGNRLDAQPRVYLTSYASGFVHPVCIANAGDSRLFVVEQAGYIYSIDSSKHVNPVPFLDIHDRVKSDGTEQGLLGLAFHPGYKTNGYFYVNYTGVGDSTHIVRFQVSTGNPDSADAFTEYRILTIYQPYINHNGGDLKFGPDHFLYIGLGDGGSTGDPDNRAQDSLQMLGKMLRIDIYRGIPYSVPPTNPFVGVPGVLPEIWALGLRNPWRFSFDRQTGDLWIADVGQDRFEEIDFQAAGSAGGQNYGWRCYEADSIFDTVGCKPGGAYTFPVYSYRHQPFYPCAAVIGGYVYRGTRYPRMQGHYFFTDNCLDFLWTLYDSSGTWAITHQGSYAGNNFSTFGEDKNGNLYIAGRTSGIVYTISDSILGINDHTGTFDMIVHPNPVENHLRITVKQNSHSLCHTTILDMEGRIVLHQDFNAPDADIDMGFLDKGLYILQVRIKDQDRYQKLIKL